MGKGTISAGGTEGRYTVDLDFGDAERDALAAVQTARIARLTSDIVAMQAAYDAALAVEAARRADVNAAIAAYVLAMQTSQNSDDWADELEAWEAAQKAYLQAQSQSAPLRIQRDLLTSQKTQAEREQARLQNLTLTESRDAWCVDLTEDGTGEVATVEIIGETDRVLIAAGCRPPVSADGVSTDTAVTSPEQAYWNYAALPGWQRWLPTYRTGIISDIDYTEHTATVTLDAATSSAQALNVNPEDPVLLNVPITYMTCDSYAFEEDDNVVVMFPTRDFAAPTVIGFAARPKSCYWGQGWSFDSGNFVRRTEGSPWLWRPNVQGGANTSWTGTGRVGSTVRTVSWHGRVGKHIGKLPVQDSVSVYWLGRTYYFPYPVHGAFAEEDADGVVWIYAQCRDHVTTPATGEKLYRIREDQTLTFPSVAELVSSWLPQTWRASIGQFTNESRTNYCSVFWNSSATAAVGMVWSSTVWPYNLVRYTRDGDCTPEMTYSDAITGGSDNESYVLGVEYDGDTEVQCVVQRSGSGGYVGEVWYASGEASVTIGGSTVLHTSYDVNSHISGTVPVWGLTGETTSAYVIAVDVVARSISYLMIESSADDGWTSTRAHAVMCGTTVSTAGPTTPASTGAYTSGTAIVPYGNLLPNDSNPVGTFAFAYGRGQYMGQFRAPTITIGALAITINFNGELNWATGSEVKQELIVETGAPAYPYSYIGVI